jgi:hypothetical protein
MCGSDSTGGLHEEGNQKFRQSADHEERKDVAVKLKDAEGVFYIMPEASRSGRIAAADRLREVAEELAYV